MLVIGLNVCATAQCVTYYQQSAHAHKPASNFSNYFHGGYNYVSLLLLIVNSDWMETINNTGATQEGACEEESEGCAVHAAGAGSSSESESSSASAASV
jgi:hypothetical protein